MDKLIDKFASEHYLPKDEIGFRLPNTVSLEEAWQEVQNQRKQRAEYMPFEDQDKHPFWYVLLPQLQKNLHEIDSLGRDSIYSLVKEEIEMEMIKDSLMEEAVFSSAIEGAFSTVKRLKEMVDQKQPPKDINDQMVLNNYHAMQFILKEKHRDLSIDFILELQKIVTNDTLDEDDAAYSGRFRDDWVYVKDKRDHIIYTPPPADRVLPAMEKMIDWVNRKNEAGFIHPIIKASFVHLYFVHIHPFFDGNGRTARALFYFDLIRNEYEFFKYFSISVAVQKAKGKYYKAIRNSEIHEGDFTYFLLYMAETILESIHLVKARIAHHYQKEFVIDRINKDGVFLNDRQQKFVKKFFVMDQRVITIRKYQDWFKVVYETARRDLDDLHQKKVLVKGKQGKAYVYRPNNEFGSGSA
ncbi:MAG: Fic family protein [Candidatus Omnitrophica bacterium]|nr:Fic family protein [Candidatus Omnitrophota bacterium]